MVYSYSGGICWEGFSRLFTIFWFPIPVLLYIVWYLLWLPFGWSWVIYDRCTAKQRSVDEYDYVLVTGASSGMGFYGALCLNALGFTVFAGVRKEADGEKVKEAAVFPEKIIPVICDVTNEETIQSTVQIMEKKCGKHGLTGLWSNAGIEISRLLEDQTLKKIHWMYDVNVFGYVRIVQACLPLLKQGRPGRIVVTSSQLALVSAPRVTTYAGSKAAVEMINDALRVEMAMYGIKCSVVAPGLIYSQMFSKFSQANNKYLEELRTQVEKDPKDVKAKMEYAWVAQAAEAWPPMAKSPLCIGDSVIDAMLSSRPRIRYDAGGAMHFFDLFKNLSARVKDYINLNPSHGDGKMSEDTYNKILTNSERNWFDPKMFGHS